jgi:hypothetical protein
MLQRRLWLFWGWVSCEPICWSYTRIIEGFYKRTIINQGSRLLFLQMYCASQSVGTAPGMWMKKRTLFYFAAWSSVWNEIFGWKWNHSKGCESTRPYIIHKTILTYGQEVSERIEAWENSLPEFWNWLIYQVPEKSFTSFG